MRWAKQSYHTLLGLFLVFGLLLTPSAHSPIPYASKPVQTELIVSNSSRCVRHIDYKNALQLLFNDENFEGYQDQVCWSELHPYINKTYTLTHKTQREHLLNVQKALRKIILHPILESKPYRI